MLTDIKIRNLKPKATRYEVWEGRGLGVRVTPAGRKSWVFMYRFEGRARRLTLGHYPTMKLAQARIAHGEALELLDKGIDPGAVTVAANQEAREAPTVETLAQEYIERWAKPRKRTWQEDQRILEREILPSWKRRKAREIRRRDAILLLDNIADRGASTMARRVLEVGRKMFNFGIERDVVEVNPFHMIKAPGEKKQRDRALTRKEIKSFWKALDHCDMDEATRICFRLLLVTAQRRAEVTEMRWDEIDGDRWTIPAARSKSKRPHAVPLSPLALELLRQARELAMGSAYVFPSPRRDAGDKPMTAATTSRAMVRIRPALEEHGLAHFNVHDLRRTAATHMAELGVSRLVIGKVLNHAESGVTSIYDRHAYDEEKEEALYTWWCGLRRMIQRSTEPAAPMPTSARP